MILLKISVIIPVLNDADQLDRRLHELLPDPGWGEVIVVDGGSTDTTRDIARRHGATLLHSAPGRAGQMNRGGEAADGDVLLFLHADTILPVGGRDAIIAALRNPRIAGGCFRLRFDAPGLLLGISAWATRLPIPIIHYGDSAFFVRRDAFALLGGYRPYPIMEDLDFWLRLRKSFRTQILRHQVTTSGRRLRRWGVLRGQAVSALLVFMFLLGVDPERLCEIYQQRQHRVRSRGANRGSDAITAEAGRWQQRTDHAYGRSEFRHGHLRAGSSRTRR